MFNLLILDDEPIIADSLQFLFENHEEFQLDIFTAYNAYDAIDLMKKTRIDIVLSDIRMPGMDGMELQKEIYKKWRDCKIIFLTGFNDFSYIQTVIRNGGSVDYILKNEDDEEVIHAVRKAIDVLTEERKQREIARSNLEKVKEALPMMQKECILKLIRGQSKAIDQEKMAELDIPLSLNQPFLMVLGRIHYQDHTHHEIEAGYKKMEELVKCNLDKGYRVFHFLYNKRKGMIWLIQSRELENWSKTAAFACTIFEDVQHHMKQFYGVSAAFSIRMNPCHWETIREGFSRLNMLLARTICFNQEVIVKDDYMMERSCQSKSSMKNLKQLESYLELGEKQAFHQLFFRHYEEAKKEGSRKLCEYLTALTNMILQYLNKQDLYDVLQIEADEVIAHTHPVHHTYQEAFNYLMELSDLIFDKKVEQQEDPNTHVIVTLQQYIHEHLHEDLSLTKLSEIAHHSPTYLSKLYKRKTGQSLSDYITEQRMTLGKELLLNTNHRVREIAEKVGYEAPYFIRYFKKKNGVTPQQFREKAF
ncbi:response regulator [Gracilibacillus sp. YIM 98692]|uniref:response regulator transcription factor n=1 Tax=Gracilibacillus sp. YIM 98692 TaxID=2663532 RepID=UPI0013D1C626|nr:response regulator [Gracilibacillus sp. YIM 98692]